MLSSTFLASSILLLTQQFSSANAGTVYGCYKVQGAAGDPRKLMGLASAMVNWLLNCDSTITGTTGISGDYAGFSGRLYNSANNGIRDPALNIISSFDKLINVVCPNSIGYWYYDGNDHTTGVIDYYGLPNAKRDELGVPEIVEVLSIASSVDASMNSTLDAIHQSFGGPPTDGIFYLPFDDDALPEGLPISNFEITLEDLQIIAAEQRSTRRLERKSLDVEEITVRGASATSELSAREETCKAVTSPFDTANGFRVFRLANAAWVAGVTTIPSSAVSTLAQRLIDEINNNLGLSTSYRTVVSGGTAVGIEAYALNGRKWSAVVGLVREWALNILLYDIGLDMAVAKYSEGVYAIADGAGNVVVRVVAWARHYPDLADG